MAFESTKQAVCCASRRFADDELLGYSCRAIIVDMVVC